MNGGVPAEPIEC